MRHIILFGATLAAGGFGARQRHHREQRRRRPGASDDRCHRTCSPRISSFRPTRSGSATSFATGRRATWTRSSPSRCPTATLAKNMAATSAIPSDFTNPRGGPADYRHARAQGDGQGQGLYARCSSQLKFPIAPDLINDATKAMDQLTPAQKRTLVKLGLAGDEEYDDDRPGDEAPPHPAVDGQGQHVVAAALPGRRATS